MSRFTLKVFLVLSFALAVLASFVMWGCIFRFFKSPNLLDVIIGVLAILAWLVNCKNGVKAWELLEGK